MKVNFVDLTQPGTILMARIGKLYTAAAAFAGSFMSVLSVLCAIGLQYSFELVHSPESSKIPFLGTAPGAEHKETTYVDHESSLLNEQIRGAGMGSLIVIFLSFSSGMHFPILLQAIMGPMNLVDNVFVKRYLLGSQVDRPFGESLHAPGSEPEAVTATPAAADSSVAGAETVRQIHNDIEQLMFDTWDSDGASLTEEAFDELTKAHAANPEGLAQYKTARQGWTLLMVLCGVHREELTAVTKALHWVLNHSANVAARDNQGENALHWACHHHRASAITILAEGARPEQLQQALKHSTADYGTPAALAAKHSDGQSCQEALRLLEDKVETMIANSPATAEPMTAAASDTAAVADDTAGEDVAEAGEADDDEDFVLLGRGGAKGPVEISAPSHVEELD